MAATALIALAALATICSAELPSHYALRAHFMEGSMVGQSQSATPSQGAGLAYVEPMALIGGQLGRGQSSLPSRTCARPLGEVHVAGRPAPSLSSLQHVANSRRAVRHDVSLRKRSSVAMDSSFDPLGLASGLAAEDVDMDTIIVQKQLWTAAKSGDLEGIESAIKGGADVNFKYPDEGDAAALQCAALNGNTAAVSKLVSLGAHVNGCDKYKWTAMHDAALNGHTETVERLVSLGAQIDARTAVEDEAPGAGERTPLTNAAMNGHTATVERLVSLGANVNARQKDGWTALHFAAKNGWEETVERLVRLGIDVNSKNDADMTALHYAAWDATIETCQKLIDLGIDINHKAKGKLSALDLADKRKREKAGRAIADLLRKASGIEEQAQPVGGDDDEWRSLPDSEWRKLIANDPYKKSTDGLDF